MIDFDALVLGPSQAVFGRPIVVTPTASQPGSPAYPARAIWSSKAIDVAMDDNSILSSQQHTLDIRCSEFAVQPAQGDRIDMPASGSLPAISFVIEDGDDDGQGGTALSVKVVTT